MFGAECSELESAEKSESVGASLQLLGKIPRFLDGAWLVFGGVRGSVRIGRGTRWLLMLIGVKWGSSGDCLRGVSGICCGGASGACCCGASGACCCGASGACCCGASCISCCCVSASVSASGICSGGVSGISRIGLAALRDDLRPEDLWRFFACCCGLSGISSGVGLAALRDDLRREDLWCFLCFRDRLCFLVSSWVFSLSSSSMSRKRFLLCLVFCERSAVL
jgi:hypothetical protein